MKFFLVIWICSAINQTCLPPIQLGTQEDYKTCLINGYEFSKETVIQEENETLQNDLLHVKFICYYTKDMKDEKNNQKKGTKT